jgi:shikimate dehydrogenase
MNHKFGLIGHHISYSLSPEIHEAIGEIIGQKITYDLIDIEPTEIKSYIDLLKSNRYDGFNVTKPYKEIMLTYVDELTETAKQTKAVNTIYMRNNKIIGDNTDVYGFWYLLAYYRININHKNVLVLGTGGAAKAIHQVLLEANAHVTFASRYPKENQEMHMIHYKDIEANHYDIFVNATPIGTYPNIEDCVLAKDEITNQIVIDLIYRPKETKLMRYSEKSYNGFMMLLAQAVKSEMLWLNKELNIHDIIDELLEVINYE